MLRHNRGEMPRGRSRPLSRQRGCHRLPTPGRRSRPDGLDGTPGGTAATQEGRSGDRLRAASPTTRTRVDTACRSPRFHLRHPQLRLRGGSGDRRVRRVPRVPVRYRGTCRNAAAACRWTSARQLVGGATDSTAPDHAREHGAYTCVAARNHDFQGAALRLGLLRTAGRIRGHDRRRRAVRRRGTGHPGSASAGRGPGRLRDRFAQARPPRSRTAGRAGSGARLRDDNGLAADVAANRRHVVSGFRPCEPISLARSR